MWWLTFPFSLPSFSLPFFYSSFLFTLESSFPSDSSDLYWKWKQKIILDGSTGNQGIIIKWAELWIKLKICPLKSDQFLMSLNNTNSLSNSNVIRKSSDKRILIDWTPCSLRYCHNTCVRTVKRVDFNILRGERTYPFKEPHGVAFAKTIFLSPPTKFL